MELGCKWEQEVKELASEIEEGKRNSDESEYNTSLWTSSMQILLLTGMGKIFDKASLKLRVN